MWLALRYWALACQVQGGLLSAAMEWVYDPRNLFNMIQAFAYWADPCFQKMSGVWGWYTYIAMCDQMTREECHVLLQSLLMPPMSAIWQMCCLCNRCSTVITHLNGEHERQHVHEASKRGAADGQDNAQSGRPVR